MFTEPVNYTESDHFFFEAGHKLEKVCNAPKDKDGVYKVLELRNGKINLVYIGCSTTGGLFKEIVNGLHSDKNPRKLGWAFQLLIDKTDAIDVYWYILPSSSNPKQVCDKLIEEYIGNHGRLPKWNK